MKRKRKKRRKEKKRREKGTAHDSTSGSTMYRAIALPLGHVEHTHRVVEFLLLKPSSLIKHEFKDIFQKNDCSLDGENPT